MTYFDLTKQHSLSDSQQQLVVVTCCLVSAITVLVFYFRNYLDKRKILKNNNNNDHFSSNMEQSLFYRFRINLFFHLSVFCEVLDNFLNAIRIKPRNRATLPKSLEGKVAVITGANSGIGKITATTFAKLGANVIMACRDPEKSRKCLEEITSELDEDKKSNLTLLSLDLSSLESVRNFAAKVNSSVSQIDYLINNAGIMMCPEWKSEDGHELQFATNHLGHFLLTDLLMDKVKSAPAARIVNLSSIAHLTGQIHFDNINLTGEYTPLKSYTQSKLANLLFSRELAKQLKDTNVTTYAVHPGLVNTELGRHMNKVQMFLLGIWKSLILISPELGAQTTLYCAFEEKLKKESGLYYRNCRQVTRMLPHVENDEDAAKLWELSHKLCSKDANSNETAQSQKLSTNSSN